MTGSVPPPVCAKPYTRLTLPSGNPSVHGAMLFHGAKAPIEILQLMEVGFDEPETN